MIRLSNMDVSAVASDVLFSLGFTVIRSPKGLLRLSMIC